jgi:hypothetical protein
MKRVIIGALLMGGCLVAYPAFGETASFAVVIGNNAPPAHSELPALKYADDDAIRYYHFFKQLTQDVYLLTVPDGQTQKRYPGIASAAEVPTLENLRGTVMSVREKVKIAEASGKKTTLYLAYSGHGDHAENGEPFLSFLDGGLKSENLYNDILSFLNTDYQHVFIDACYAEGVVGFRGAFDREAESRTVNVSDWEKTAAYGGDAGSAYPGLGIIISSAKNETTHEWSRFESGVFTHEVLSGLAGPADINNDGKIEYSELVAFISVANLEVTDSRGRIEIIARPPARNQNVPIVDLAAMKSVSFLVGNPSKLGHFVIELRNGLRYLDANLSGVARTHIAVPNDTDAYLQTRDKEALLSARSNRVIQLATLDLKERGYASRGGIEDALRKGLFAATYGQDYYQGFVESSGFICVRFDVAPFVVDDAGEVVHPPGVSVTDVGRRAYLRPLAIFNVVLAGTTAAAGVAFGAVSLMARRDFRQSTTKEMGQVYNDRYVFFGTAAWVALGVTPVAAVVGALLWLKHRSSSELAITPTAFVASDKGELGLTVRF